MIADWLAWLLAFFMVAAIDADIQSRIDESTEPANLDGVRMVQLAIEQGGWWMDQNPPRPCYAEWWALERAALSLFGESLYYYVAGSAEAGGILYQAARFNKAKADDLEVVCR